MPTRVYIVNRVVGTVRIQMPRIRILPLTSVAVPSDEPSGPRLVISGIEVQQSGQLVMDCAGVLQFVFKAAVAGRFALGHVSEVVIQI